jgi:non-heme chloroperoxidase
MSSTQGIPSSITDHKDHQVPWAISKASYKRQKHNPGITEIAEIPGHGHALTIDKGWQETADIALEFIQRFTTAE